MLGGRLQALLVEVSNASREVYIALLSTTIYHLIILRRTATLSSA
jgi:hypothetical protein